ncbi:ATP-binding protein [Halorussus sp. AFM4]|uniref:sensor histidine kinase n=1 Tax=Halorussus sp. AFM4 TaxID=3421651 RepID=UPI003EBA6B68
MEGAGNAGRVLYVGDPPGAADFAEAIDEAGLAVTRVSHRSAALDRLDADSFDCVVGDVADGLALLDAVRDRYPDLPYVYVADDGDDDADEALARGATDYLERRGDRDQRDLLVARVVNAASRRDGDAPTGSDDRECGADDEPDRERVPDDAGSWEHESSLRELYRTASNADLDAERKRHRMLELGRERLGVDVGFVSHIEDGTMEIVDAVGSHELLQSGQTAPLADTYCRKTIEADEPLSVADAESEGWRDDPAYETYGLGCYVGAKLFVDDELYGTVCFADRASRSRSFSENERLYVELISQWLGYEQERLVDERALREQNRRLEEFASVVSHDLRNPLNVARIYLTMAEETGDEADFEQVRCAHDRMEQRIRNLLALARGGDGPGDVADRDLSAVATAAWENVEADGAALDTEGELTVAADRERLQRLLENLFRNAVEHGSTGPHSHARGDVHQTESDAANRNAKRSEDAAERDSAGSRSSADDARERDGAVTIRVGPLDGGEGFYVADDGPGIPEDRRESVFEHGYSTVDGGTGLGLAIVRRVAEAHDWSVSVGESEAGGARFEVRWSGDESADESDATDADE